MGAATAYYLAQRDVGATIIERSGVACAASGKAGGFLALDWQQGSSTEALSRRSFALHAQLAQDLEADTGYRTVSTLSVTASVSADKKARSKPVAGCPSWLDGHVHDSQVMGDRGTTAQVHPERLTKALLTAAEKRAGGSVVIGTVTGLLLGSCDDDNAKRVQGVKVGDKVVPADAVVIAMGPWSAQAAEWLPIPKISGQKATSVLFRPSQAVGADMVFLEYRDAKGRKSAPEVYPRPDGTVYMCGEGDSDPLPDDPSLIRPSAACVDELQAVASNVSSFLAAAPREAEQACFLPCSPDGSPLVGAVKGVLGAYIASGHSCWGILNGPATGEAITEIILDGRATTTDVSQLDPGRFVGRGGRLLF